MCVLLTLSMLMMLALIVGVAVSDHTTVALVLLGLWIFLLVSLMGSLLWRRIIASGGCQRRLLISHLSSLISELWSLSSGLWSLSSEL